MLGIDKEEIFRIIDEECFPIISRRLNADLGKEGLSDSDLIDMIKQAISEVIIKNNIAIEEQLKDLGIIS